MDGNALDRFRVAQPKNHFMGLIGGKAFAARELLGQFPIAGNDDFNQCSQ